jgi:endonuclease YncB( thermonuclease family)
MSKLHDLIPPFTFALLMGAVGVVASSALDAGSGIHVFAPGKPAAPAPKHDLATVKLASPPSDTLVYAVDGDTLHIVDGPLGGLSVRLTGFDAPETWKPHCPAEKALGTRATARMKALLQDRHATLTITPGHCAYGRACGVLTVGEDKRDAGAIMIGEGLAAAMACPGGKCEAKKDWCR